MTASKKQWLLLSPPYRPTPESFRQIVGVTAVVTALPVAAAMAFFGYHALVLVLSGALAGAVAEKIATLIRRETQPGSMAHSALMGVWCALILPAAAPWHVAAIGAAAGVLIGKQFFGGLGRYIWNPALIGRLIVQLFFHDTLSSPHGALLARPYLFFGDMGRASSTPTPWYQCNWFSDIPPLGQNAWLLEKPLDILRQMTHTQTGQSPFDLAQFMLERLPDLKLCILGAAPGGLGETCAAALILAGVYLVYRGYMHWQLPVFFLLSAWLIAGLLPLPLGTPRNDTTVLWFPFAAGRFAQALTYMNYHLFSGELLFAACLIMTDMTSRPITARGQAFFGIAAGVLTIIFTLYTPIFLPCYAAILAVSTFTPTLDRLTRPAMLH
jgi:Na+-translocating ferredoxin:NAD+ oxidoreductase subunit D